ncbi:hypothetical protein V1264_021748 [Littorina saxatilis]|uniref:Uncharacterized protein n=1 Tax=Littorina saxatilis TaxID=31220 RepID=A0AAN9FWL3_9CAEN
MAAEGDATASTSTAKLEDSLTQTDILKSMQTMMSQMMNKVVSLEENYNELAAKAQMCDDTNEESDTAVEADDCATGSGVKIRNQQTSLAGESGTQTVGESNSNSTQIQREKASEPSNTQHVDDESESGFCVVLDSQDSDVFSQMEADLEVVEPVGMPVNEKLANITKSRFTVRMPEPKLKEKMSAVLTPGNCLETRPPRLNEEVIEKGNIDKMAKKVDMTL